MNVHKIQVLNIVIIMIAVIAYGLGQYTSAPEMFVVLLFFIGVQCYANMIASEKYRDFQTILHVEYAILRSQKHGVWASILIASLSLCWEHYTTSLFLCGQLLVVYMSFVCGRYIVHRNNLKATFLH